LPAIPGCCFDTPIRWAAVDLAVLVVATYGRFHLCGSDNPLTKPTLGVFGPKDFSDRHT
jgi:hypothetical protein